MRLPLAQAVQAAIPKRIGMHRHLGACNTHYLLWCDNRCKHSVRYHMGPEMPFSLLSKSWNVDSVHTSASKLSLISPEPLDATHLDFSKQ